MKSSKPYQLMNQSAREFAALGRIVCAIKRFHHLFPDSKLISKEAKDTYLKQHLSGQDWKFWKQLQVDQQEMPVNKKSPLLEKPLTRTQFNLLLGQYRRAGVESYQFWCQTQRQTEFGLGDTLPSC